MMKSILATFICLTCLVVPALAQRTVTGTVRTEDQPLFNVNIVEKGVPTNGTTSDGDGKFSLKLKGGSNTVIFTMIGFMRKEVNVSGNGPFDIKMEVDAKGVEEVVVVGYGKQKKITNTGAVTSITGEAIRQTPSPNIANTLMGRLPGYISQQRGGRPGAEGTEFFIRGISSYASAGTPLIIVDDIELGAGALSLLDPNEIETLSILKDASTTAIYGVKGANGVIVITTRRGKIGPPRIAFRSETGMQRPTRSKQYLGAYESALLTNEAMKNDNVTPRFTDIDLQKFKDGSDPYGHPDIDWYKTLTRPMAMQFRNNLDVSGGLDFLNYFISVGYLYQNGILKDFSEGNGFNSNYYHRRYNFRSNLDITATKSLNFRLDLSGIMGETNSPNVPGPFGNNNVFFEMNGYNHLPPFAYPVYNPDGSYGFILNNVRDNINNIVGRLALDGYNRSFSNDININLTGNQDLAVITKGLSARVVVAYSNNYNFSRSLTRTTFPSFQFNPADSTYTPRDPNIYRIQKLGLGYSPLAGLGKRLNLQAQINYDRTFGKDHRIYGLVMGAQTTSISVNTNTGSELVPSNFRGFTGRLGYNFRQKYMFEFNGAYNGSDRFAAGKRFGFFPAFSAGWNVAEEPFFANALPIFSLFKFRGSYGFTGVDGVGSNSYIYDYVFQRNNSYSFGESHNTFSGIREGTLGNPNVTWEKEKQWNIAAEFTMLKGKISGSFDLFNRYRYDILSERSIPAMFGQDVPVVNLGRVRNKGFEADLTYQNTYGKFGLRVNANVSHAKNKVLFRDEEQPRYPGLALTGHPIGSIVGYRFDGFYQSDEDIQKSAKPNGSLPRPGDLKYKDLNGDNVIDAFDREVIGNPNLPNTIGGLNIGLTYKGISLNMGFQGAAFFNLRAMAEAIDPFSSNLQPIHRNRWTPETKNTATFPSLHYSTLLTNSSRDYPSDFWFVRGDYLRLRTVELGYDLPASLMRAIRLKSVKVYANGFNLLTWSKAFEKYQMDPEIVSGGTGEHYPQQKVFNVGIQVGF